MTTWSAAALGLSAVVGCGTPGRPAASWCDRSPRAEYEALERIEVSDSWFQVYRVGPGVLALYEPHQFQEVISYLILGSERALLFDTGMGMAPMRPLVERLTTLPVTVLNSHTHYDHIGGNAEFDAVFAMDPDYTREPAGGWPHEQVAGEVTPAALCAARLPGFDTAAYRVRPFTATRVIADGETIDLGGRRLEVLSIPGHAPDAIALLDREAGLLWTGDTFYEGPIWLYFPGTDLEAYERSVARLAELVPGLARMFPAHNTPLARPERLVELRDAFAEVRAGRRAPRPRDDGLVEYQFPGFSFLMKAPGT
jgi:glyoxylase-like metal-dependent hydrolase (beta-lactamase superfamily II)